MKIRYDITTPNTRHVDTPLVSRPPHHASSPSWRTEKNLWVFHFDPGIGCCFSFSTQFSVQNSPKTGLPYGRPVFWFRFLFYLPRPTFHSHKHNYKEGKIHCPRGFLMHEIGRASCRE